MRRVITLPLSPPGVRMEQVKGQAQESTTYHNTEKRVKYEGNIHGWRRWGWRRGGRRWGRRPPKHPSFTILILSSATSPLLTLYEEEAEQDSEEGGEGGRERHAVAGSGTACSSAAATLVAHHQRLGQLHARHTRFTFTVHSTSSSASSVSLLLQFPHDTRTVS